MIGLYDLAKRAHVLDKACCGYISQGQGIEMAAKTFSDRTSEPRFSSTGVACTAVDGGPSSRPQALLEALQIHLRAITELAATQERSHSEDSALLSAMWTWAI